MTAFTVTLIPRRADTDFNGHVTAIAYHDWADQARVAYLRRAGVTFVQGDFGPDKTWRVHQRFLRSDGVLAARIESTWGLLDHRTRRLTEDPHHALSELATDPGRL
ncbi:acyl-CoA thioesterase [Amycolatopsis thailandensis]|uniref:acyl-CoA thioesterase n=1 Tax=Amycolatopsis thailandensis TaxID=589330 RepID=UPI003793FB06